MQESTGGRRSGNSTESVVSLTADLHVEDLINHGRGSSKSFVLSSYYVEAEYNFEDMTWYSRLALKPIRYAI